MRRLSDMASNRHTRNEEERVLPLINVVFLLLIFFMVAGQLSASDPFKIEPPAAERGAATEQRNSLVLIGADGKLALDGKILPAGALQSALTQRFDGANDATVRVKADAQAKTGRVVAVMHLLRKAGADKIRLLTVPEGR